jgi:hypothetical protein
MNPDFASEIKFNGKRGAKIDKFTKQTVSHDNVAQIVFYATLFLFIFILPSNRE